MADQNPGLFFGSAYETERLKTLSVWSCFAEEDLRFRPATRARSPLEHMVHQCVSEDTWMRTMLGVPSEMAALPASEDRLAFLHHYAAASKSRQEQLTGKPAEWWFSETKFFDVARSRAWVFLRRLNHSAHHRGTAHDLSSAPRPAGLFNLRSHGRYRRSLPPACTDNLSVRLHRGPSRRRGIGWQLATSARAGERTVHGASLGRHGRQG
jgi:hypothetical protein